DLRPSELITTCKSPGREIQKPEAKSRKPKAESRTYDTRMLTRRRFATTSTAPFAAGPISRVQGLACVLGQGRQRHPPPTPVTEEIRRNVGFFTASGGTIGWLINPTGVVVVDSQFPQTASLCLDEMLKKSGKAEIAALINTHHHGDHTGGNG